MSDGPLRVTHYGAARPWNVWRLLFLIVLLFPAAVWAAPPAAKPSLDLAVVVFVMPEGPDRVAVAYQTVETDEQLKQDFAAIARELGSVPPKLEISRAEAGGKEVPAVSASLSGLTDRKTGAIKLDPLIHVYRRYGHFRAQFVFFGSYPLQPLGNFNQPPVRVAERVGDHAVEYEIWVDQSHGVPATVPKVTARGSGWNAIIGIAVIALVVAGSVFLILQVMNNQRRASEAGEGKSLDEHRS